MDSASAVLGQFLLVALLVERIVAVGVKLLTPGSKPPAEDMLDPPIEDPWKSWSKAQVVTAFAIAFAVCYQYDLDLFSKLLLTKGTQPRIDVPVLGMLFTSAVIAGGSTGLQKMLAAVGANAKAIKAEARARIAEARGRMVAALK